MFKFDLCLKNLFQSAHVEDEQNLAAHCKRHVWSECLEDKTQTDRVGSNVNTHTSCLWLHSGQGGWL